MGQHHQTCLTYRHAPLFQIINIQGVGHFTIYDDGSDDDPWSVLRKYAALGLVEFEDMRGHPRASTFEFQLSNLNTCFTNLRARHQKLGLRWLLFTDIDELVLSGNKRQLLTDLLNEEYRDVACMEVARTFYGTSFHHRRPPSHELVTETYLLASPDYADGYPKMLANIYPEGGAFTFSQNATSLHSLFTILTTKWTFCGAPSERFGHSHQPLREVGSQARYHVK